jgi:D-glycero-alpha-D-manno-heptose-7-phosphate kinase
MNQKTTQEMLIRARAPLRLGLAGGGSDVSPYCDVYGGCVLNATIDRYAYANIRTLSENKVRFIASDQIISREYNLSPEFSLNDELILHKAVYNEIISRYNNGVPLSIELSTFCDAPMGSGLGSSSTLVVAIIKSFVELLNLPLDDYTIAKLAYQVERIKCGMRGGRQDQYSAAFGGFNYIEFFADERVVVNSLRVKNWILCELEASLLLFYTGVSRESARIISDQRNNMLSTAADAMDPFHGIKREANQMKECVLKGDIDGVIDSMLVGWENKKKSAATVSNETIEEIYSAAITAGAKAGKVSGAGGGGFMMFIVPPERRMEVVRCLSKYSGQISNAHFTKNGAQAWRVS